MTFDCDSFDKLTPPSLILCKGNHDHIGIIHPLTYEYTVNFSDMNQVSFSVAYMVDGEETPNYDLIDVMHFVEVEDQDFFLITSVNVQNEGTENETKEVTATSAECTLGQKYISEFVINYGTTESIDSVQLYNVGDKSLSLLHLALELAPEWEVAHVDTALQTMRRSFEVDRQDIYSFLMEDVATAFDCFFKFDTINQRIYVYSESNLSLDTNIYVSYNNLLEKGEFSCSTDDIKTCLELVESDTTYGSVRELNASSNKIYNFDTYNSTDYWSQDLYDAYNAWQELYETYMPQYNTLLAEYQEYYTEINDWQTNMIPSTATQRNVGYGTFSIFDEDLEETGTVTWDKYDSISVVTSLPSSTDTTILWILGTDMYRYSSTTGMFNVNNWIGYSLDELETQLTSAQNLQSVAMKAGYGDEDSDYYVSQYLIYYNTVKNIEAQIEVVEAKIETLETEQAEVYEDMQEIAEIIAMSNNFTEDELKELSQFIREDQISSDNYVVTSIMDDDERFETLQAYLDYATEELYKVAMPQLSFSASILNLFEIPEFDTYSGEFEVGNYIWVVLRDNFKVKAKLLTIKFNFYDASDFSVEFGNVYRSASDVYTAIQEAINNASSAATSVSMNRSYWTESAKETDDIGEMLSAGLLAAGAVLTDGTESEMVIDSRGIFVNTSDDSDYPNDSIFIGGGRILFTDDDWLTVSEAIGRIDINGVSTFGVLAQAVVAGYIAGSLIEGSTITGNTITGNTIANANGTFKVDEDGQLVAAVGYIACDFEVDEETGEYVVDDDGYYVPTDGFVIKTNALYNSKSSLTASTAGVYIGTDGISLGKSSVFKVTSDGDLTASSATISGTITAGSGSVIGAFTITDTAIYNTKSSLSSSSAGVYIGTDGIGLGANTTFQVTKAGALTAVSGKIGGFTLSSSYIAYGKTSLTDSNSGVYIGTTGIALGASSIFKVTSAGALTATSATITGTLKTSALTATGGTIGGFTIDSSKLYTGTLGSSASVYLGSSNVGTATIAGTSLSTWRLTVGANFGVTNAGALYSSSAVISGTITATTLTATSGTIGGITISSSQLAASGSSSAWYLNSDGSAYFSTYITASSVASTYATITSLNAATARISTIESDYVTTSELNAVRISASQITSGTISTDILSAANITTSIYNAYGVNIYSNAIVVSSGSINAAIITGTSINGCSLISKRSATYVLGK